ncbi:hypothetical protein C8Q73DRAFT_786155 [Cubamyces lactineus]|nr:hypothetical protein C8Q73DRAFT_786155 [Cubamyces lactineus]
MNLPVINVSSRESSPAADPPRRTTRSGKSRATRRRSIPVGGDVIELTDSDCDELPENLSQLYPALSQQNRARKKAKTRAEPVAGPSRPRAVVPPAAVPAAAPTPARAPTPPRALPLFLPDLDMREDHPPHRDPTPVIEPRPVAIEQAIHDNKPMPNAAPEAVNQPAAMDDTDPFDGFVAQVLEIIPDVLPAHVYSLIEQHYPNYLDKVVEPVLHTLFENPDYPRADAKGKGKRKHEDDEPQPDRGVKPKIDYGNKNRRHEGGYYYGILAVEQLAADFPDIPTAHIRLTLAEENALYAPAYMRLREQQALKSPPYKRMSRPRPVGKGKGVAQHDEELYKEIQWVREKISEEEAKKAAEVAEELRLQEEGGIECGCCFCEYPFDKMIQCPEAHLFCTSCMMTYAETKLGEHDAHIVCMDQSGCKLPFPESELRRFLTPKLLELYERVKQRKEIEAAGLENLEECPFCDYKVVIENEHERLFRCENEACGAVTCRACKKPDHLPKSCQEVADDKKLDIRHAIEEAMTRALMRNCPKCQKAFIKEMGCNKMTCPNCGALSCYVCRKLIKGYDHFANPPPYHDQPDPKKCPLWDASVEGRHSDEVTAAAKQAIEEYKRAHPELNEKDLAVDLPPPPPAAGPSRPGAGVGAHHVFPPHPPAVRAFGAELIADFRPALPPLPALPHHYHRAPRRAADRERRREERGDIVRMWQRQVERNRAAAARFLDGAVPALPLAPPAPAPAPPAPPRPAPAPIAAQHHGPVYNVHVHIDHARGPPMVQERAFYPPAMPAMHAPIHYYPAPVAPPPALAPIPAHAPPAHPVMAEPRRSKRVQQRRAN